MTTQEEPAADYPAGDYSPGVSLEQSPAFQPGSREDFGASSEAEASTAPIQETYEETPGEYVGQEFGNSEYSGSEAMDSGSGEFGSASEAGYSAPGESDFQRPAFETSDSSDFSEVAEFGNAEVTQAAFSYSVRIEGIDSAEVRKSLEEALNDSKFNWNPSELMSQIKDGALTIRSVSAVKASILVQRIKYLPVKISWRQDVLSGSV